jgi:hypothetical protein
MKYLALGIAFVTTTWAAGETTTQPASQPAPAAQGNIIQNGSFEVGLMNWGCGARGVGGYPYDIRLAEIDPRPVREKAEDAPEGRYVLRFDAPPNARWSTGTREYELKKGMYRVSGCFKTEQELVFSAGGVSRAVSPSPSWQEVSFDVPVEKDGGRLTLSIVGGSPGVAQMDKNAALQGSVPVTSKSGVTRMDNFRIVPVDVTVADLPVQVGLETSVPDKVFLAGDKKQLVLRAYCPKTASGKIAWRIENAWGDSTLSGEIKASLKAGEVFEQTVPLELKTTGHYRVLAQFQDGSKVLSARAELLFAVLPDREFPTSTETGEDSHFGCNIVNRPMYVQLARKVGIRWVMCAPPLFTKWLAAEPRKGEWLFYDEQVKALNDAGIHLLGNLADAPLWATDPGSKAYSGPWANNKLPTDWAEWENYVRTVVTHYYPRIKYWAVWNEPNHSGFLAKDKDVEWFAKYTTILQHTCGPAKAAKPDVKIVAGTVTHPAALLPLITPERMAMADILAFHWASWSPRGCLRNTVEEMGMLGPKRQYVNAVERITDAMKAAGKPVPLWDTECHVTEAPLEREFITQPAIKYDLAAPSVMTRIDAANTVVRQTVAEWAAGVDKTFLWLFSTGSLQKRDGSTLFEWDGSPGAAVPAYAVMTKLLEGATFEKYETKTGDMWIDKPVFWTFYFKTPKGRVRVVWSNTDDPHELLVPVEGKKVTVYDLFGVECPGVKVLNAVELKNEIMLCVGRSPYYIIEEP